MSETPALIRPTSSLVKTLGFYAMHVHFMNLAMWATFFLRLSECHAQNAEMLEQVAVLHGHTSTVYWVFFLPGSKRVVSGGADGTIRFWDSEKKSLNTTLKRDDGISALALSPDGKTLASAGSGLIRIWDCATEKEQFSFEGAFQEVDAFAFSSDGKAVAVAGRNDDRIRFFGVKNRKEIFVLKGNTDGVLDLAFSPDGKLMASSNAFGLWLWKFRWGFWLWQTGKYEVIEKKPTAGIVHKLVFSPKGDILAVGKDFGEPKGSIVLWDVKTRKPLRSLKETRESAVSLAFSPDGKLLASGSADERLRIWNVATGRELTSIVAHERTVGCISFSPNGRFIATGGLDKTVRIWRIRKARDEKAKR